ncbi:MAG: ParB/RepB/Spo0J family partition protein, partial [Parasporobacterium sp.]|nr:ParB/RepB/Spo0J family partition protein [Parasporobacterium sp.]
MSEFIQIDINDLIPHPDNPRKDLGDLAELTESIRTNGILQNLTVVKDGDKYKVIIGHRRLAAAKAAGLTELPCTVADMDERQQLCTMMEENMQRQDLTIPEQAYGFQYMLDLGETVSSIA